MQPARHFIRAILIATVTLCGARTAAAQVTSLGTTTSGPATDLTNGPTTIAAAARSAVAYDDKHDVFLHVWEHQGTVVGRFINFDGTPARAVFTIATAVASYPVAVYSRGTADDVFCVLVNQRQPDGSSPSERIASFIRFTGAGPTGGTPVGTPTSLASSSANPIAADGVFNPNLRRFLLAWALPTGVAVQHFDASGNPADGAIPIPKQPLGGFASASVNEIDLAYDWQQRKYLMADVEIALFPPSLLTVTDYAHVLDESKVQVGPTIAVGSLVNGPAASDATYLPEGNRFLASYGASPEIRGRLIATDPPSADASYTLVSGHNDGTATIEYDALSRRALLVDESSDTGPGGTTYSIGAALLDGLGQTVTGWMALRSGTTRFLAPFVRATTDGQFVVSYINGGSAVLERVPVPLASPAGPRFSNVLGHVDGPVKGATVGSSFLFNGWVLDFGASTGTGIDAVHAWAFPDDGSPAIFLGADQAFHARGDVASLYGPHFANPGFGIQANGLGVGTYTLVAYGRSIVSGAFAQLDAVTVTVVPQPFMNLDGPSNGTTVGTSFTVDGWAIDLSAPSGTTGVDAVHVWAYPNGGGSPAFIGADYGRARTDVGAAFGAAFTMSGFHLDVTTLPPGGYRLVAYAHDTLTGTFNIQQGVDITVAAPVSQPLMAIDVPAASSTHTPPFLIGGWAIDLGAASGPGVDAIHVWAFNTNGSPAIFAGAAAYGSARPDVGTAFGASRFTDSGYNLTVTSLPQGTYDIGVYARSTVSGTFNQVRFVRVTVP
jgi:hypothetical protein